MEYFAGAFIAISVWIVASKVLQNKLVKQKMKRVVYRQSHLFEIIKPAIPFMPVKIEKPNTQATKHQESHMMRFLFLNGKAYWIANNAVFVAEVDDQGIIEESKKVVDTMTMDDVQLKEIEFIVNKLTEGNRK